MDMVSQLEDSEREMGEIDRVEAIRKWAKEKRGEAERRWRGISKCSGVAFK
jgi:hypothetical protein